MKYHNGRRFTTKDRDQAIAPYNFALYIQVMTAWRTITVTASVPRTGIRIAPRLIVLCRGLVRGGTEAAIIATLTATTANMTMTKVSGGMGIRHLTI